MSKCCRTNWLALMLVFLGFITSSPVQSQSCSDWARTNFDSRGGIQAVYDPIRNKTVVFGGILGPSTNQSSQLRTSETWLWNGDQWSRAAVTGPPARSNYAMTFDAVRGVVVLFGGFDGTNYYNDTWEWDGTAWTLRSTTGPAPRADTAMTFDSARGVAVLFGGGTSLTRYGGTWEWNGSTWSLRSETGPPARIRHAMAYDPIRQVTVLAAGITTTSNTGTQVIFRDTWEWNGDTWTSRGDVVSGNRYSHQMVFDPNVGAVVMHGGQGGFNPVAGVVQWDGSGWQTRNISLASVPSARFNHGLTFDTARGLLIVVSGLASSDVVLADTWELGAANTWSQEYGYFAPSPRSDFAFDFDPVNGRAVAFGLNQNRETWVWDAAQMAWSQLIGGDAPTAAPNTTMVFDSNRGVFVLTGGGREETWELPPTGQWTSRKIVSPSARQEPVMGFDPIRNVVVLFGGGLPNQSGGNFFADTWEYDGNTWSRVATSGPPGRSEAAMAFDPVSQRLIMFGGWTQTEQYSNDTWAWDGAQWTAVNSTLRPSRRRYHCMATNPETGDIFLLGGQSNTTAIDLADPWVYRDGQWSLMSIARPIAPRHEFGAFFNSITGRFQVFGGLVTYPQGVASASEMWELILTEGPILPTAASTLELNSGSAFTLSVPETGTAPVAYQWSRDGIELTDNANISGSTTRTLELIGVTPEHSGQYSVIASNSCGEASAVIAHVTVKCPGDANNDNICNGQDLSVLLSSFGNTVPAGTGADFNASGQVNGSDISVLLSRFGQGCSEE